MTGDIGEFDEDGFLKITDRKKDIIITANGKNIAPQLIESRIGKDFYVEQIAIIGDRERYLVALIVPAFPALEEFALSKGVRFKNHEELIKNPAIIQHYAERIESQSKDLPSWSKVQKFTLLPEPLTVEKGDITPTMKLKRKVIAKNYEDIIQKMYAE